MRTSRSLLLSLGIALGLAPLLGSEARAQDATEIMKKTHLNYYYAADDGLAHVHMTITNRSGKTRERVFIMLRKDFEEGGVQKYYAYFVMPADVRRTTFMAWKNPTGDDSRWIFIPALDLVKPISANDKKSSFVGSDFSYEDVSGRHWTEDEHRLVREEELDGAATYVIESVPKERDYFARKVTWVDKARFLPLREEYYKAGSDEPVRILEALEIQDIDGVPTVTHRRMTNTRKKNSTDIVFTSIQYNVGIPDGVFSERYLKSPPREYIQE